MIEPSLTVGLMPRIATGLDQYTITPAAKFLRWVNVISCLGLCCSRLHKSAERLVRVSGQMIIRPLARTNKKTFSETFCCSYPSSNVPSRQPAGSFPYTNSRDARATSSLKNLPHQSPSYRACPRVTAGCQLARCRCRSGRHTSRRQAGRLCRCPPDPCLSSR